MFAHGRDWTPSDLAIYLLIIHERDEYRKRLLSRRVENAYDDYDAVQHVHYTYVYNTAVSACLQLDRLLYPNTLV